MVKYIIIAFSGMTYGVFEGVVVMVAVLVGVGVVVVVGVIVEVGVSVGVNVSVAVFVEVAVGGSGVFVGGNAVVVAVGV